MSRPTISAIAFDWGGIFTEGTFDSSAVVALADLFDTDVETVSATYFPLMAPFEVGDFELEEFHRRFLAESGLEAGFDAFRDAFLGAVRERTAMYSVLGSIPDTYTVGMLSNNVPVLCDRVRDDVRMSRIERFVFSNEIGVRKPDPRAYEALTAALEVPPEQTVFVDDSEANIEACEAFGYTGIHLDSFEGFLERWSALFPDLASDLRGA